MNKKQLQIQNVSSSYFANTYHNCFYSILLFEGNGEFEIDFVNHSFSGITLLFLTPYQSFRWINNVEISVQLLKFHGDYYCIEYHKKEVACNGLLFNNIYENPYFEIDRNLLNDLTHLISKMKKEYDSESLFSESILKSYVQLILAISSKVKSTLLLDVKQNKLPEKSIVFFQKLVENNFLKERSVSFYAAQFSLSIPSFSKKIKQHFGKTPIKLIQERVVLEAKKLLHLTYKSIKEIAAELNFDDEFYFSRYFKKAVGLSPANYREHVGISIVAKKSMQ